MKPKPVARAVWKTLDSTKDLYSIRVLDKSEVMMGMFRIYHESALEQVRREALEEAARVCEELGESVLHPTQRITDRCAAAIRALIEESSDDR